MEYKIPEKAADSYDQLHREGRILSGEWRDVREGRQFSCALDALAPEAMPAEDGITRACAWMPQWLPYRILQINDYGSNAEKEKSLTRLSFIFRNLHKIPTATLAPGGLLKRRDKARAVVLAASVVPVDVDDLGRRVRAEALQTLQTLRYAVSPEHDGQGEQDRTSAAAALGAASAFAYSRGYVNVFFSGPNSQFDSVAQAALAVMDVVVNDWYYVPYMAASIHSHTHAAWDALNSGLLTDLEAAIKNLDFSPFPALPEQ